MKSNSTFISTHWGVWVIGLLGILMVQGCGAMAPAQPPSVDVRTYIGDCNNLETLVQGEDETIPEPGGCYARNYTGSATGFWNMDNDTVIQASEGKQCDTGKKCRNPGSMCNSTSGLNYCYSTWKSGNTCLCACGQL